MGEGDLGSIRATYAVAGEHVWEFLAQFEATCAFLVALRPVLAHHFGEDAIATLQVIGAVPSRVYVGVRPSMDWYDAMQARSRADSEIKFKKHLHPASHPVWVSVTVTKEGNRDGA